MHIKLITKNTETVLKDILMDVPMSLTRSAGTYIIICRSRGSNPGQSTYTL